MLNTYFGLRIDVEAGTLTSIPESNHKISHTTVFFH